jgi:hypothetical protein
MTSDVMIHPIISKEINHSGQFIRTGNSVSGDTHEKNVKPTKNAGIDVFESHCIKTDNTNDTISTV